MTRSLLYGVRNSSVEQTAAAVEALLGCTFEDRDSSYLGHYMLAAFGSTEIKVVTQPDPEGDPLEDDFEAYKTLVYVVTASDLPGLEGIQTASGTVERLREKEWDQAS